MSKTNPLLFLFIFFISCFSHGAPQFLTFQSQIYGPTGVALTVSSVDFKFSTLSATGSCVLYVETFNSISLAGTGGAVHIDLGSGTQTFSAAGTANYSDVFNPNLGLVNCQGSGTYTPAVADNRRLAVQFNDGTAAGWQTLPAIEINSIPFSFYAGDALKLGGHAVTDFVLASAAFWVAGTSGKISYSGGYVGLGTTTPSSTLTVNGSLGTHVTAGLTANYTLTATDHSALANASGGAFTLTLPTAVGIDGRQYVLKKTDTSVNKVTVATTSSQTIDGAATYSLYLPNQYITVMSDGANWVITNTMAFLTACPTGMKLMGMGRTAYCVDNAASATTTNFGNAARACLARGLKLCTYEQLNIACNDGGTYVGSGGQEWLGQAYSSSGGGGGRAMLLQGCDDNSMNYGYIGNSSYFRCCVQ